MDTWSINYPISLKRSFNVFFAHYWSMCSPIIRQSWMYRLLERPSSLIRKTSCSNPHLLNPTPFCQNRSINGLFWENLRLCCTLSLTWRGFRWGIADTGASFERAAGFHAGTLGNIAAREMTEVRVLLHLPLAGVNRSRASLGLLCKFILCAIEMAGQRWCLRV